MKLELTLLAALAACVATVCGALIHAFL